jgi:uncharacterized membrane protein
VKTSRAWAKHEFEIRLGRLLQIGVSAAAAAVLIGGIGYLVSYGAQAPAYHDFHGQPRQLRSVFGILAAAAQFHPAGVIALGLLLLIATPIARVAFAAYAFARQRDWLYAGVSCLVLTLLLYGLVTR